MEKVDARKLIRMTPAEMAEVIRDTPNLSLATLDREGYPHLVAMSYALDANGDIVMTSFGKAQKVVNLRRDPRAAIMVEKGSAYDNIKGVMIRGRAEIIEDSAAVLDAMRLIVRKGARLAGKAIKPGMEVVSPAYQRQALKRVVIKIRPRKWASWDHSKLTANAPRR